MYCCPYIHSQRWMYGVRTKAFIFTWKPFIYFFVVVAVDVVVVVAFSVFCTFAIWRHENKTTTMKKSRILSGMTLRRCFFASFYSHFRRNCFLFNFFYCCVRLHRDTYLYPSIYFYVWLFLHILIAQATLKQCSCSS